MSFLFGEDVFLMEIFFVAAICSGGRKETSLTKRGTDKVAVAKCKGRSEFLGELVEALVLTGKGVGLTNFGLESLGALLVSGTTLAVGETGAELTCLGPISIIAHSLSSSVTVQIKRESSLF